MDESIGDGITRCPICDSRSIEAEGGRDDVGLHHDYMFCDDCGATWTAAYSNPTIQDVTEGEEVHD